LQEAAEAWKAGEIARKDPRGDFESSLIQRIHRLDQRVRNQEKLISFCEGRGGRQRRDWSLANRDIDQAMDAIGFELESILLGHDMETSLLTSTPISSTDLTFLVRSYLLFIGAPLDGLSVIESFVSTCDMSHLIRTLTVVALREWVFQTDFPNFTDQDSPFLRSVRKNIMAFGKFSLSTRLFPDRAQH
jgi:hypothetical protein